MARIAIPQPATFNQTAYRTQYYGQTACIICGKPINENRRVGYSVLISNDFQRTPNQDELVTADEPDAEGGQAWSIHRSCAERPDIAPFVTVTMPPTDEGRWMIEYGSNGAWEAPGDNNLCDSEEEAEDLIAILQGLDDEWASAKFRIVDLNEVD